jgi:sulfate transport system ATP-binding protein
MSIELEKVTKQYGDGAPAVADVSFKVEDGELVALLGPSGSGKSTILRMIAGLLQPDAGRILMRGHDVTSLPTQKRNVGFVFQNYALFKHMTVANNVAFGLKVQKWKKTDIQDRVKELLSVMQLADKGDRYPSQLSGGERQRVAIARALAPRPEILLMDEPFGAIDTKVRIELREWLRRLHDDFHVTSIFVTHDQDEALEISNRVVVMSKGRIEQIGSPREIFEEPASAFVTGFVGPVNVLRGTAIGGVTRIGSMMVRSPEVGGDGAPVNVLIRPSDIRLRPAIHSAADGFIARVAYLGPTVKVEVDLSSGDRVTVHVSRDEFDSIQAQAREWGLPWTWNAGEIVEGTAEVSLEIRDARIFPEDFSI